MKEIVVLSGKGGTGKTVVTASLVSLLGPLVAVDCDVDAANLGLMLGSELQETYPYLGMKKAVVMGERCTGCGRCADSCAFFAITIVAAGAKSKARCDLDTCEGCGLCQHICPQGAIDMTDSQVGERRVHKMVDGWLLDAYLEPPAQNTGRLVSLLRSEARALARRQGQGLLVTDGPPGIGCPAISSLAGADLCLLITEPTLSGLSDLERALGLAQQRRVRTMAIINRFDLHPGTGRRIMDILEAQGVPVLGTIPIDDRVPLSICQGRPTVHLFPDAPFSQRLRGICDELRSMLDL
jgi:MinD superfamily P-loop ATPase